ncbi:MAG: hypothetical protein FWG10_01980 [Eubacteriaceae bacterium]|nr:hypothetical protein [Eubacteriaceae bacterium]
MLSCCLLWHFNQAMKAASSQEGTLEGYTYKHTIEVMKALQKSTLDIAGTNVSTEIVAEPTEAQKESLTQC